MTMIQVLAHLKSIAWILPGFLLWAAFPPMGEKTDVLFALAPLLWLSRRGEVGSSVRRWTLNGLVFWLATLAWMPAIVKNGGPWFLVMLGWFALSAYCALYFAAFGFFDAVAWRWARENGGYWRRILAIFIFEPVLWCGFELVRSRLFGGFAWNQLGVVAVNGGFGSPAAIGGVYLVSAVVILINGTIAGIIERVTKSAPRFTSVEIPFAFLIVWGVYLLAGSIPDRPGPPFAAEYKVAMIQRNFQCVFKADEVLESPYEVYDRLMKGIEPLHPFLTVLPESAMGEFGALDSSTARAFGESLAKSGGYIIAGGSRRVDGKEYNSAVLYGAGSLQIYDKVHLVPFGEYIPGDKIFPALQRFAPVGSCTAGALELMYVHDIPLGIAICFEDTDSAQIRKLADLGAKMLVFITNDSWFSHSSEAVQHSWQAVSRAIETRLPVVRVGNSGVTGFIADDGTANWLNDTDGQALVDKPGAMLEKIAISSAPLLPTPYVVIGDAPLFIVFMLLIFVLILIKYRSVYEKRRKMSLQFR